MTKQKEVLILSDHVGKQTNKNATLTKAKSNLLSNAAASEYGANLENKKAENVFLHSNRIDTIYGRIELARTLDGGVMPQSHVFLNDSLFRPSHMVLLNHIIYNISI